MGSGFRHFIVGGKRYRIWLTDPDVIRPICHGIRSLEVEIPEYLSVNRYRPAHWRTVKLHGPTATKIIKVFLSGVWRTAAK